MAKSYTFTLTTASPTGASFVPAQRNEVGGVIAIGATGTWGGAVLTVQAAVDGTNFAAVKRPDGTDLTFSANFADGLRLPPNVPVRMVLTTVGSGASVACAIASDGA